MNSNFSIQFGLLYNAWKSYVIKLRKKCLKLSLINVKYLHMTLRRRPELLIHLFLIKTMESATGRAGGIAPLI